MDATPEILLMDKTEGVTSFRFLDAVKKAYPKSTKIGHAGTLDKFASGLMIVLVGNATRLNPVFSSMDKSYEALIRFGTETDTLDPDGRIVKTAPVPAESVIDEVLSSFKGKIMQRPPKYSAVHVDGKRAYKNAVKGLEFEMPFRQVEIFSLEKLSYDAGDLIIRVHVSKGTYIRSLARDIGEKCSSAAHLEKLRRLSIGPYHLDECLSYDTKRILDETGLFGTAVYSKKFEKQIINGIIRNDFLIDIEKPDSKYFYMYLEEEKYAICERIDGKMKVLARFGDEGV